ncbi:hypothetical protein KA005_71645, partial [bacterium]|nr:hypothetical protein [bacterium]
AAAAQIAAMGIACCLSKGHKDFANQRNICSKFAKLMIIFNLSLTLASIYAFKKLNSISSEIFKSHICFSRWYELFYRRFPYL